MLLFGGFFGTLATLASLECFLRGVAGQVAGQCPLLERDTSKCPATTDLQELDCIAHETTMKELINCVRIDDQQQEKLCRSTLPGSDDDYYHESEWIKALGGVSNGAYCVTPGLVLVSGSRPARCAKCQLLGLFQSCPQGHPQYHRCLCARRASRKHFQSCLGCFKVDFATKDLNDLDCNSLGRRDITAGDEKELESRVLKSRNEAIAYYELPQAGYDLVIDEYYNAWAYYKSSPRAFGDTYLPYSIESSTDGLMVRCYVSPWYAVQHCVQFSIEYGESQLPSDTDAAGSLASFSATRSYTTTASSAPSVALPTEVTATEASTGDQPSGSRAGGVASSSPTGASGGGTAPTSSGVSTGSRGVFRRDLLLLPAFWWAIVSLKALC